jgi:hypothetical protein
MERGTATEMLLVTVSFCEKAYGQLIRRAVNKKKKKNIML